MSWKWVPVIVTWGGIWTVWWTRGNFEFKFWNHFELESDHSFLNNIHHYGGSAFWHVLSDLYLSYLHALNYIRQYNSWNDMQVLLQRFCMWFESFPTFSLTTRVKFKFFWDVTPWSLLKVYQRFEETSCLHLRIRRVGQESSGTVYRAWNKWYRFGLPNLSGVPL
jgi:hypothetical protein